MHRIFSRFSAYLSSLALSLWALSTVAFAAGNPNTGDDNKVGLVMTLLIISVVVIVLLLVLSAMKKKKSK